MEIKLSPTLRSYLTAIYRLGKSQEWVPTGGIAAQLGVSDAAVTQMLGRLSRSNLVRHRPYKGVHLTDKGTRIAIEMIRHHRLLETFLHKVVGMPWDQIHDEAEHLQAHISPEFERRIDALLDYPQFDPHGSPIPSADGMLPPIAHERLEDVAESGSTYTIRRVSDRDPKLLRYLEQLGLAIGTEITVEQVQPFDGPIMIRANGGMTALGREAARRIYVGVADVPSNGNASANVG